MTTRLERRRRERQQTAAAWMLCGAGILLLIAVCVNIGEWAAAAAELLAHFATWWVDG